MRRGACLGSGASVPGVCWMESLGGATALRLEIQSMFWLLHPGAVIGTLTIVQEPMEYTVKGAKEAGTRENTY